MKFLHQPDSYKRVRVVAAMMAAYLLSSLVLNIFFIGESPSLNPQAFTMLGDKAGSFSQTMRSLFVSAPGQGISSAPDSTRQPSPTQGAVYSPASVQPSVMLPSAQQPPVSLVPTFPVLTVTPYVPLPSRTPTQPPSNTPKPQPTQPPSRVTYAQFGQCLNDRGMVMYMSATCGLCSQQKKTLKDAYNYIRAVDCNASQQNGLECSQVGVRGLPTWGKNGKAVLSGPQTNEALAQEAGCQAPVN